MLEEAVEIPIDPQQVLEVSVDSVEEETEV
jgi:hypothetical protein